MARPRKNPDDPKWAVQNVGTNAEIPTGCNKCGGNCSTAGGNAQYDTEQLMAAVLMAGYIARGGPIGHDQMLRQARELIEMIRAK